MNLPTEWSRLPQATARPAARLARARELAESGPGLLVFWPTHQCLFRNPQATRLMQDLRPLDPRRRTLDEIPHAVSRCCQELEETLHRHPNPTSWGRVQLVRRLGGEGNMILARFHAIPAATEPGQIALIVGLLEPCAVAPHPVGPRPPAPVRFTEREQACVTHLIQGMTDKEIAQQLGLSEYTVKDHFKHVRKKTGATNRAGIIARVLGRV